MQEGYVESFGTAAGRLVDKAATLLSHLIERILHAIGDSESHVLNATAAAIVSDKLGDCAILGGALEQLNLGLADAEECCAHLLVSYLFDSEAFQSEHVLVEGDSFVEAGHGDADVFDVRNFHDVYDL